jgi:hypothetical protein
LACRGLPGCLPGLSRTHTAITIASMKAEASAGTVGNPVHLVVLSIGVCVGSYAVERILAGPPVHTMPYPLRCAEDGA